MVQQIVDENGTLRHIILSALNNAPSGSTSGNLAPPILQVSQTNISQVSPHGPPLVGTTPPSSGSNNNQQHSHQQIQHQQQASPNQQQQHQPQVPVPSSQASGQPSFSSFQPCCCSCCVCAASSPASGVTTTIPTTGGLPSSGIPGHPALLGCFPAPMTLANGSLCPTPVLSTGVVPTSSGSATNGSGSSSGRRRTPSRNSYSYSKRSSNGSTSSTPGMQSNATHINLNPLLSSTPNCSPVVSMSGLIPTAPPFILPNSMANTPVQQNNLQQQQPSSNNLSNVSSSSSKTSKTISVTSSSGNTHQLSPASNEFHYMHGANKNIIIPNLSNGRPTSGNRSSSSRQVPQQGIPNTLVTGLEETNKQAYLLNGANFSSQIHHNQQQQQQSELISGHKLSDHLNNKVSTPTPSIMTSLASSKNHSISPSSLRTSTVSSSVTSSHSYKSSKSQVTSSNLNNINYHPNNNGSQGTRQELVYGDQSTTPVNNKNLSMNASSASSASVSPNSLDSSSYSVVSSLDSSFSRSSSSSINVSPLSSRQLCRLPNGSVSLTSGHHHPHPVNGSSTVSNNSTRKSSSSSVSSSASSSPPTNGSSLPANNIVVSTASTTIPTSPVIHRKKSRKDEKKIHSLDSYNSNTDSAVDSCPENQKDIHRIYQQDFTKQGSGKQHSNSTSSSTLTVKSSSPSSPTAKPGSSASNSLDDLDDDEDVESQDNRKVCVTSMTITNQSHIEPYEAYVTRTVSSPKCHSSPNSPLNVVNNSIQQHNSQQNQQHYHYHGTNNAYLQCKAQKGDPLMEESSLQSLSLASSPVKKRSDTDFPARLQFQNQLDQPMSSSSSTSSVLVVESSLGVTTASLRKKTMSVNHSMSSKSSSMRHDLDSDVCESTTSQKVTKKQKDKTVNNDPSSSQVDEKSRKNKKLVIEDSNSSNKSSSSSSATSTPSKKNSRVSRAVKSSDSSSQGLQGSCSTSSIPAMVLQEEPCHVSSRKVINNDKSSNGSTSRQQTKTVKRVEVGSHKEPSDDDCTDEVTRLESTRTDEITDSENHTSLQKNEDSNLLEREEDDDNESSSSLEVKQQKVVTKVVSPKHMLMSLPQYQLLNLTYTALTATSAKLKWNLVSGTEPHPEDHHRVLLLLQQKTLSAGGLFSLQFKVELIQPKNPSSPASTSSLSPAAALQPSQPLEKDESSQETAVTSETMSTTSLESTSTNQSASPAANSIRNVYQGTCNTCRVSHLTGGQQYSFRVRTFLDSEYCVLSNLLTITTPEQALTKSSKQHKGKGSFNANGSPASQSMIQENRSENHKKTKEVVNKTPVVEDDLRFEVENEKKDQRRAALILLVFTLSALVIAILIQQLLGSAFESTLPSVSHSVPSMSSPLPLPPVPSLPYPPV